jgi:hypothetical protein
VGGAGGCERRPAALSAAGIRRTRRAVVQALGAARPARATSRLVIGDSSRDYGRLWVLGTSLQGGF